jgi:hypothetical protein
MTSNQGTTDPLPAEIARVNQLTRSMIDEYVSWRSKIVHGEIEQFMYSEMLDFVNFRIETADTCLLLIEHGKIADALGLSRSIFENYLLLMLMCRGTKYFKLRDLSSWHPERAAVVQAAGCGGLERIGNMPAFTSLHIARCREWPVCTASD